MNKRAKVIILFISCILLAVSVLGLSGCKNYEVVSVNDTYKSFAMKDSIAKFSFEYNNKYELSTVSELKTGTNIFMNETNIGQAWYYTHIAIYILEPEAGHIGYEYYLERLLNLDSKQRDFTLVQRIPVTVAGEIGEKLTFHFITYPGNEGGIRGIPPSPFFGRRVMFWHNNMLWWLEIRGPESNEEADKADFEHILHTFKILDQITSSQRKDLLK